jgi:molecular chaperone GrpE
VSGKDQQSACEQEAATAAAGQAAAGQAAGAGDAAAADWDGAVEPATVETDPVAVLEADLLKWRELALRTAADLENYRKRMARDRQEAVRFANQGLLEELLPVLDNFEMGMEAAAADKGSMIYVGMDMVRRQFADLLAGQGVTPVAVAAGDEFDPTTQEALTQEASDAIEPGRVVRVMRRGFRLHERLLRPATVVVSCGSGHVGNKG